MSSASTSPDLRRVTTAPGREQVSDVLAGSRSLTMHLQPVVELDTGRVWAVEALARFPGHPHPGPDMWFRSAERDGTGLALEELTLGAALALLPRLPSTTRLSVNLSARALLRPPVQRRLLDAAGGCVIVELTEHEQVADYPELASAVRVLRRGGIGLGIDDFGAGHSSLRHVLHLEPEVVKLDLALVQGVAASGRRQALVEALLTFCRRTGTQLIAEGVESDEDLQALRRLGVELAQGFLLARPGSPDRVLPLLDGPVVPVLVLP